MKILALEFSSPRRSAALLEGGEVLGVARDNGPAYGTPFSLIASLLKQTGTVPGEVGRLAINVGPGSYTGIRAGISIVQGWSLSRPIDIAAFTTFDSLSRLAARLPWSGPLNIVLDAQRHEFLVADYVAAPSGLILKTACRLLPLSAVAAKAAAGEHLLGPGSSRWFAGARDLYPAAETLGELASGPTPLNSTRELEPFYGRETNFVKIAPVQ